MKRVWFTLFGLLIASVAIGFQGFDGSQDLKLFNTIKCGPGVNCSREGDKFLIETGEQDQILSESALTLTSSQCGDTVLFWNANHVVTLPEASTVRGCRFTFTSVAPSGTNYIDLDAADTFPTLTNAYGDRLSNGTDGQSITVESVSSSAWNAISIQGTWSDAN